MRYVLAVVCPPLAVLTTGSASRAAVNLGLTALGFLPGVLHAVDVVGQDRVRRRNRALLRAVDEYDSRPPRRRAARLLAAADR